MDWLLDEDEQEDAELLLDCEELELDEEDELLLLELEELELESLDALFVLELELLELELDELVLNANCTNVIISNAERIMVNIVSIPMSDHNDHQAATLV